jgi:hypothetical protein
MHHENDDPMKLLFPRFDRIHNSIAVFIWNDFGHFNNRLPLPTTIIYLVGCKFRPNIMFYSCNQRLTRAMADIIQYNCLSITVHFLYNDQKLVVQRISSFKLARSGLPRQIIRSSPVVASCWSLGNLRSVTSLKYEINFKTYRELGMFCIHIHSTGNFIKSFIGNHSGGVDLTQLSALEFRSRISKVCNMGALRSKDASMT